MYTPHMVEAWFVGGPGDGAVRDLEPGDDGQPPPLVAWRDDGVFVGSSDQPAPTTLATYERATWSNHLRMWIYRHAGTLSG